VNKSLCPKFKNTFLLIEVSNGLIRFNAVLKLNLSTEVPKIIVNELKNEYGTIIKSCFEKEIVQPQIKSKKIKVKKIKIAKSKSHQKKFVSKKK
jgi:hypothetical protein